MGIESEIREEAFLDTRERGLALLKEIFLRENNFLLFERDNELWTIKKILRRFIWHDRIHAKAMTRILAKQRRLGMVDEFEDPLYFLQE